MEARLRWGNHATCPWGALAGERTSERLKAHGSRCAILVCNQNPGRRFDCPFHQSELRAAGVDVGSIAGRTAASEQPAG
jgi:hypothetical protein